MKGVACKEWGWVTGRVFSFYNIEFTKVAAFGSGVSKRTLGAVVGAEDVRNINTMTNDMPKAPSKSIYINHHIVTSVNDNKMAT